MEGLSEERLYVKIKQIYYGLFVEFCTFYRIFSSKYTFESVIYNGGVLCHQILHFSKELKKKTWELI